MEQVRWFHFLLASMTVVTQYHAAMHRSDRHLLICPNSLARTSREATAPSEFINGTAFEGHGGPSIQDAEPGWESGDAQYVGP